MEKEQDVYLDQIAQHVGTIGITLSLPLMISPPSFFSKEDFLLFRSNWWRNERRDWKAKHSVGWPQQDVWRDR
jgi:hypothetical protein